jgi:uncharacterized membrane protein HdeD (DUF308 family)
MSSLAPPPGLHPEDARFLHQGRVFFLSLGIALALLGVIALGESFFTTIFSVFLLGFLVFFAGVAQVTSAVLSRGGRGFAIHLLAGIIKLIVGVVMIRHLETSAAAITLLIAAVFLVSGAYLVVLAAMERFHGWPYFLGSGVLNLLMGLIIWSSWPESSAWVIGMFVGIDLLYLGVTWIMLALAMPTTPPTTA